MAMAGCGWLLWVCGGQGLGCQLTLIGDGGGFSLGGNKFVRGNFVIKR